MVWPALHIYWLTPSAGLWGVRRGRRVSGHHATKARNRHSEITNKTKCQPGLRRPRACSEPRVDIPTHPPPPGSGNYFFFGVWNSCGGAVHTIMQNLQISCEIFAKFPLVICETAKKNSSSRLRNLRSALLGDYTVKGTLPFKDLVEWFT